MPWEGDDEANEMETEDMTSTADLSLQDILRVLNKPEKQVALVLFLVCAPVKARVVPVIQAGVADTGFIRLWMTKPLWHTHTHTQAALILGVSLHSLRKNSRIHNIRRYCHRDVCFT